MISLTRQGLSRDSKSRKNRRRRCPRRLTETPGPQQTESLQTAIGPGNVDALPHPPPPRAPPQDRARLLRPTSYAPDELVPEDLCSRTAGVVPQGDGNASALSPDETLNTPCPPIGSKKSRPRRRRRARQKVAAGDSADGSASGPAQVQETHCRSSPPHALDVPDTSKKSMSPAPTSSPDSLIDNTQRARSPATLAPTGDQHSITYSEEDILRAAYGGAGRDLPIRSSPETIDGTCRCSPSLSPAPYPTPLELIQAGFQELESVPDLVEDSGSDIETHTDDDELPERLPLYQTEGVEGRPPASHLDQSLFDAPEPIKGFHVSSDGGLAAVAKRFAEILRAVSGKSGAQTFVGSPRRHPREVNPDHIASFLEYMDGAPLDHWTLHGSHITNLASPDEYVFVNSIQL